MGSVDRVDRMDGVDRSEDPTIASSGWTTCSPSLEDCCLGQDGRQVQIEAWCALDRQAGKRLSALHLPWRHRRWYTEALADRSCAAPSKRNARGLVRRAGLRAFSIWTLSLVRFFLKEMNTEPNPKPPAPASAPPAQTRTIHQPEDPTVLQPKIPSKRPPGIDRHRQPLYHPSVQETAFPHASRLYP